MCMYMIDDYDDKIITKDTKCSWFESSIQFLANLNRMEASTGEKSNISRLEPSWGRKEEIY